MKKIIKTCLGILAFLLLVQSCESEIDPTDFIANGENRYPAKASNLSYFAGKNRLMITFRLGKDPNLNKSIIYWNMKKDSVEFKIDRSKLVNDSVNVVIDNLPENVYNFEVYTFDKFGNKSVPMNITGKTYGTRYASALQAREIISYEAKNEEGDITVTLGDSILHSSGIKMSYADRDGVMKSFVLSNNENKAVLERPDFSKEISVQTLFMPEKRSLDTFYVDQKYVLDASKLVLEILKPYTSGFVSGFDSQHNNGWAALWNNKWGLTYNQNTGGTPWASEAGWSSFDTKDQTADQSATKTWFTVDLEKEVRLSRYRTGFYWPYLYSAPKITEIWAYIGNGQPSAEEGWNNWEKIGEADNSALTLDKVQERTLNYPLGDNIYFNVNTPKARYYRIVCTENWETRSGKSKGTMSIAEVTFWKYLE